MKAFLHLISYATVSFLVVLDLYITPDTAAQDAPQSPVISDTCPPAAFVGGPLPIHGDGLEGGSFSLIGGELPPDGIGLSPIVFCGKTVIVDCPPLPPGSFTLIAECPGGVVEVGVRIPLVDGLETLQIIACLERVILDAKTADCFDEPKDAAGLDLDDRN